MTVGEGKISLVEMVIKEFGEMEKKRREDQYKEVLQRFKTNIREGNGFSIFYNAVLYDDVRERLQKEGFNVEVITCNPNGRAAYYITIKDELRLEVYKNLEMSSDPNMGDLL